MKIQIYIRAVLFLICLSLLTACSKKIEGCIDAWANNNCHSCNTAANEDCEYTSSGVFWYQSTVADSIEASGSTSLSYFIDGQPVGTTRIYHGYWPPDPLFGQPPMAQCNDDSTFTYSRTWKGNREHSFNYSVKNQSGVQLWSGSVLFRVKACASTELR